jgi:hypothetical protein
LQEQIGVIGVEHAGVDPFGHTAPLQPDGMRAVAIEFTNDLLERLIGK